MTEQEKWERANNIFTLITQRDDSDSWREAVMSHLGEVYTEGFDAGRDEGYAVGHENGYETGYAMATDFLTEYDY